MPVMSVAKFERFFRVAAGLDVDKKHPKRYSDFVNQKTHDLLIRGKATAKANGRDIIEPFDLPPHHQGATGKGFMISGISTRRLS